ncbi:MAG TPA: ABC transporter substrate-binding protein [Xanthobacteraceae bacterium]|nr:ABC transporter substrate-binding protein [Xanthobacteraceae bacterium]
MAGISRRSFVAGAAVAAPFVVLRGARAKDLRPITFTLPWVAEGSNAYAYVAKAKGFWEKRGLDVQISRGYGSTAAAQAVGAGKFQFGLAAASAGIQEAAKGLPVKAILSCGYDATMGICVLKDGPIHTVKDLEGHKMASTVSSGDYPFLPLFAQKAGFDLGKVERVQADPNVRQRLLISKEVDAISGFAISFVPVFETQNVETRNILFSSSELTLYNNSLMTQVSLVEKEPQLCSDVAAGLAEAVKFTMLNPDEAVQLFLKEVPEVALTDKGADRIRLGVGIFIVSMLYKPLQEHGVGYAVPQDYEVMTELVMKYIADKDDKTPTQAALFTNDYAGTLKLDQSEWDKAMANAKPYRAFLA